MIKTISEKISELRKSKSLTQEQLGTKLGVSSQAVSKWEKGESMPDIMLLPKLCAKRTVAENADISKTMRWQVSIWFWQAAKY